MPGRSRIAHEVAAFLHPGAAGRDAARQVPPEAVDHFSNSGLWGIQVPKEYGGVEVSYALLAEVIAIISAADPSLGQIPQSHYCLPEDLRLQGTEAQKRHHFGLILQGYRFDIARAPAVSCPPRQEGRICLSQPADLRASSPDGRYKTRLILSCLCDNPVGLNATRTGTPA